jgi:hypothetical protein
MVTNVVGSCLGGHTRSALTLGFNIRTVLVLMIAILVLVLVRRIVFSGFIIVHGVLKLLKLLLVLKLLFDRLDGTWDISIVCDISHCDEGGDNVRLSN